MKHAMSCGCASNAASRLRQGLRLSGFDASEMLLGRGRSRRDVDPRPVEGREPVGLRRVGVGQRHRVAGPAVERARSGACTWCRERGSGPAASLRRLFQSKAALRAFSTARAPPSTKKRCGRPGHPARGRRSRRTPRGGWSTCRGLAGLLGRDPASSAMKSGSSTMPGGWRRAAPTRSRCTGRGIRGRRGHRPASCRGYARRRGPAGTRRSAGAGRAARGPRPTEQSHCDDRSSGLPTECRPYRRSATPRAALPCGRCRAQPATPTTR